MWYKMCTGHAISVHSLTNISYSSIGNEQMAIKKKHLVCHD